MYELELFAGAGGGILGKNLLGHTTVGAVEIEPYCRRVLLQRQRDLCCPMFPIWDDVRSFRIDNEECSAYIEWLVSIHDKLTISGGFPCQDISASGKGCGIAGKKSGLWFEMARIIREIRPAAVFVENSPMLATRGLEQVLASLAEMGMMQNGVCWALDSSDTPLSETVFGYWGNISRTMAGWMTPGTSKEAHLRSTYGAQKQSLVCQMLRKLDLWPTVLLVELLMGWPPQWTALQPLAMDRFRQWRRSTGGCLPVSFK